ncbi:MAG: tetratricopeptide repeat protein [Chlorobi bacterium]|nr:tetratricopeptide repeat protein [Chlorobiota bacterium]
MDYVKVDKITYKQYINKDWKNLVKTGKDALKEGIDFYYLQVRMGIAYYELKNYAKAIKYFERAYYSDYENELVQEYLYYSYIFMGRYGDARGLAGTFKRKLKERLGISAENPLISSLSIITKHDFNEDYQYNPSDFEVVNQQTILNQSFYNINLLHLLGDYASIYHGYSNLRISSSVLSSDIDLPSNFEEDIIQSEYYLSFNYQLGIGTNLGIGFHYLNTNYSALDPNPVTIGRWGGSNVYLYDYTKNSFVGSFTISKQISIIRLGTAFSIANMNDNMQLQPEGSITIFPFGNSKFYTHSRAIYLIDDNGYTALKNFIFKQSLGIRFSKYSWFEPSATFGNMKNFTSYNALIANNDIDGVKQRYEALFNFGFSEGRFNIFIKYQYNVKENIFEVNGLQNTIEYTNQSIIGGLTWYFKKY